MELRQLRHFVAVAEELHFARAAERLGMEQSPLSHSIRKLESDLGVTLLHRTTRRTWLTRAGARFYDEALHILALVETTRNAARSGIYDRPERYAVGLADHAVGGPFTRFLFELQNGTPPIEVDLDEVTTADAARRVAERSLDLAIVLEPINGGGLESARAWAEHLSLILPIGHPLADRSRLSLRDVATEPFVLPHPAASSGCDAQVRALLDRFAVRPPKRTLAKYHNVMTSLVATGRGVALLSESLAQGLTTVAVVPLMEQDATIVSWLMFRDGDSSEYTAFARKVASMIDTGGEFPRTLSAGQIELSETLDPAP